MKDSLRWRIWYRTGESVDSGQMTWAEARRTDIVAVVWQRNGGPIEVELGTPYYLHFGDWIARVWDATLYLRPAGVKIGRWCRTDLFEEAWRRALQEMDDRTPITLQHPSMKSSIVSHSRNGMPTDKEFSWSIWYDNGQQVTGFSMEDWEAAPADGLLAVCYHHLMNGVRVSIAIRRYSYYYWRTDGKLVNTYDLEELLKDFPQFKVGCPTFTGNSYLHQAIAISDALKDDLQGVPPEHDTTERSRA